MKLDGRTLSVDSMLANGYAARNLIEFYRMLEPAARTERNVLEALAARYAPTVLLDENGAALRFA